MSEENKVVAEQRELPKLKHPEPDVSPEEPWQDDVLDRAKIAEKLTSYIRDQRDPFVISIDGKWGTGKTFLLKRWQKELEDEGFRVIHFNAWEDDFCDDPLLSIIGQLSEHFKRGKLKTLADEMGKIAVPLLKKNALLGLSRATGLTFEVDLNERDLLQEYRDQRQCKTELKGHLAKMSAATFAETGHPLVFIIDELDRCRPTFAIELLERVKHIFDVSDIVFVFGVNRDEFCSSLNSVYGDIEASVYLRRFFDMEFSLPETNTDPFCRSLMRKYRLEECFRSLSESAKTAMHFQEYRHLSEGFPALCVRFGLSLRDIDYCVRLLALTARSLLDRQYMYPYLLGFLIPLKFKEPLLYRQFISGERLASEVMNFVDEVNAGQTIDPHLDDWLAVTEAYLYVAEGASSDLSGESTVLEHLRRLQQGEDMTDSKFLSERTKVQGKGRADRLLNMIESEIEIRHARRMLNHLVGLIDFSRPSIM